MKEQNSGTVAEGRNCIAEYHVCWSVEDFKTYVSLCLALLII
jgi:hypothetical protein